MNYKKSILLTLALLIIAACIPQLITMGKGEYTPIPTPLSSSADYFSYIPLAFNSDQQSVPSPSPTPPAPTPPPPTGDGNWSTVAANPQRTSWTPAEVPIDLPSGSAKVIWYRPIEAYIPQNVQIIASNGLLYISTARGLYALDATTGAVRWQFNTELPLGNSPTVADGVVYVGGFDRKIHALDALNGTQLWEFAGAQSGFSTNPLVVDGKVIMGNRDGSMYAVGAQGTPNQGQLIWKFQSGGPIVLSAAYKNGIVYFAANDNFAYALNSSNGTLVWKSQKLPGDGYESYWPVIYTDPTTGNDLVIFSVASGYRWGSDPGANSITNPDLFPSSDTLGPVVNINQPWAQGKTVIDYSRVTQYFEDNPASDPNLYKPWRREYIILNANNGSEYTYDSDHDGFPEYTPVLGFATGSGNDYPPIVGKDNLLYFSSLYFKNGQGRVMGWRVGTPYMALSNNQGDTAEPQALSAGGNLVYRSICCDRVGDWFDSTDISRTGLLWHYGYPLSDIAPGYDVMWWFFDPNFLDRLGGNYGDVNGSYHNHGIQNPIVPYQGKLFIHRSNAIIAFGSGQVYGKLPLLKINPVVDTIQAPTLDQLKGRLEVEIQKIVAAGHLRPGYYNAGQFNDSYPALVDYFNNPGDSLYTLSAAYPYLSSNLQQQLRTYLQNEFDAYFDPEMDAQIGWANGANRGAMPIPPEVVAAFSNYPKTTWAGYGWSWQYPQYNFYAMWKYALIFPRDAGRIYDLAKSKIEVPVPGSATTDYFAQQPWELNGYIAGYTGFLKLQELAGKTSEDSQLRSNVTNELNRLLNLRVNNFSINNYYVDNSVGSYTKRTLNVARNFIMLVPELGNYLNQNALSKVQAALDEYNSVSPYWFVSRYDATIAEGATENLYDYPALFQAKAYILKEPRAELTKYLDVPAFERGDLFYIQNLIAAIEAP
jgi:outer membrane protein assembly factor BamB